MKPRLSAEQFSSEMREGFRFEASRFWLRLRFERLTHVRVHQEAQATRFSPAGFSVSAAAAHAGHTVGVGTTEVWFILELSLKEAKLNKDTKETRLH